MASYDSRDTLDGWLDARTVLPVDMTFWGVLRRDLLSGRRAARSVDRTKGMRASRMRQNRHGDCPMQPFHVPNWLVSVARMVIIKTQGFRPGIVGLTPTSDSVLSRGARA